MPFREKLGLEPRTYLLGMAQETETAGRAPVWNKRNAKAQGRALGWGLEYQCQEQASR